MKTVWCVPKGKHPLEIERLFKSVGHEISLGHDGLFYLYSDEACAMALLLGYEEYEF